MLQRSFFAKIILLFCMVLIPTLVYVGWITNSIVLTRILPTFTPMNPVTTVLFLLIGITFAVYASEKKSEENHFRKFIHILLGLLCIFVGGCMIVKYLGGVDIAIDRIFFTEKMGINRMAPKTSLNFFLLGISLVFLTQRSKRILVQVLCTLIILFSFYAVTAYIYNFIGVYGSSIYNPMALHTAVMFIGCSTYILLYENSEKLFFIRYYKNFVTWFENKSIRKKFIFGFGTVTILTLFLCIYAIASVRNIERITHEQEKIILASQSALLLNEEISRSIERNEAFISTGDIGLIDEIYTNRSVITDRLKELREYTKIPEVIELLDTYTATRQARTDVFNAIITEISNGKKSSEFQELIAQRDESVRQIKQYIEAILTLEKKSLNDSIMATSSQVRTIEINLIVIIAGILFLIASLSILITRSILSSINKLILYSKRIQAGEYGVDLSLDTKDEIGILSRTLDSMAKSLVKQTSALEIANAKNEAILSGIGDAVFAVDSEGTIILFNPIAENLSGIIRTDAIGKKYTDILNFVHEETGQPYFDFVEASLQGENTTMKNHTLLVKKDGKKIPVSDSAAPIKNDKGDITGAVIVFRDATVEHEIDRAKTEFVSLASHQLRTPISAIRWYTELLLGGDAGKISQEQKEFLLQIDQSSARMASLVGSLLNVSRIDLGTLKSDPVETNISTMVDSVLEELSHTIDTKALSITKHVPDDLPRLSVDENLMRIVLQNIISNAVKYTPKQGSIGITLSIDETSFHFIVSDTGYGIPESARTKLYTKLYRADNILEKDTDGNGLGLYLVKSILEAHAGSIRYESKEHEGTTFFITLPRGGMRAVSGTKTLHS